LTDLLRPAWLNTFQRSINLLCLSWNLWRPQ
jgi:hypothetical protein